MYSIKFNLVISICVFILISLSISTFAKTGENIYDNIKFFQGSEVKLEYLLTGKPDNTTILFVHGLGPNLRQFEKQQKYFSKNFQVLSISLRGHGNSTTLSSGDVEDYQVNKYANDIYELLTFLNIHKVHFVGHSTGGVIGYELLKQYPDLFISLVTFGTTAELKLPDNVLAQIINQEEQLIDKNGLDTYAKIIANNSSSYPEVQDEIYNEIRQCSKEVIINTRKNIANYSYLKLLEKTNIPILLIQGEKDIAINKSLGTTLNWFNKKENLIVKNIEDAGHFSNLEKPEKFNHIIENFILK